MADAKIKRLIDMWYWITICALIILAVKFALPLILPFILAAVVAAAIRKPINVISSKTKIKRETVSFITVAFVTLMLILILFLLIYSIYAYLSNLLARLPELLPELTDISSRITKSVSGFTDSMPQSITNALTELPANLISSLTKWLTSALSKLVTELPSATIAVIVTVFASFLMTRDYYKLGKFIRKVLPEKVYHSILRCRAIAGSKSFGMIKGYALLTFITFFILLIGFVLLKIPYSPAIAAIVAFIDMLPVLGTGIVLIPWAFVSLLKGNFVQAIGLVVIYAAASLMRNILSPRVLGNQIKLDSLTVLISMYVGYGIFGITGMIIAPFIAAVVRDAIMENNAL